MSKFVKLSVLALSLAAAGTAMAQAQDGQWRGSVGASGAITQGNSESRSVAISGNLNRATAVDRITLNALINRAQGTARVLNADGTLSSTSQNVAANNASLFGQYDYNITSDIYGYGNLGFLRDGQQDLNLRTSVGAGLGYHVIKAPDMTFDVYGGLGYSADKYGSNKTVNGETGTSFSRASVVLGEASTHAIGPQLTAYQSVELQPGISGDKAMLIKATAGGSVALTNTISATLGLTNNYNSKPALGNKKNDLSILTGVNVKLGAN
ncbi:DUF481 domain-containing protein [Amphibiibacter pelophylacis]|uniref:DUF481 domain-containing protein n=1 Tax=Amphibiibacter pelophylacis TaxID=1799477 RepID=A0ACC6P4U5_9BURK